MSRRTWTVVALVAAAVLFWAATNNEVYDLTSPPELSWHVALRKAYSVVAFAVVGLTFDKALGPSRHSIWRATLVVALYSAAIELVQWIDGSQEGLGWNTFDVLCGALGGALGTLALRVRAKKRRA
ncbi:MAG TPA: hypothetical protein VE591_02525 [Candidatus Acidoferrum sp.]|nr:hypothetical protein [Candidatus Acidoferrum sp.]